MSWASRQRGVNTLPGSHSRWRPEREPRQGIPGPSARLPPTSASQEYGGSEDARTCPKEPHRPGQSWVWSTSFVFPSSGLRPGRPPWATGRARDTEGTEWREAEAPPPLGVLATSSIPKERMGPGCVVVPAPKDQEGALLNQRSGF